MGRFLNIWGEMQGEVLRRETDRLVSGMARRGRGQRGWDVFLPQLGPSLLPVYCHPSLKKDCRVESETSTHSFRIGPSGSIG